MKQQAVLFFVFAVILILASCHPKAKKAKVYHDKLLQLMQEAIDASLDYGDAIQSHDKTRAMAGYLDYSKLINNNISKIKITGDFEGDTTLEHYSLEMLGFYKATLEQDFKPILDSLPSTGFTEAAGQRVDSLYSVLTMTENRYWDRFNWAERKFYNDYHLEKVEK